MVPACSLAARAPRGRTKCKHDGRGVLARARAWSGGARGGNRVQRKHPSERPGRGFVLGVKRKNQLYILTICFRKAGK